VKVAVFGAAGQLGRRVILRLLREGSCSRILAADRDPRGLADLQARFGGYGVTIRYLDADDMRSVRERMSGMDAVISCLGGSSTDQSPLAQAAVEQGRIYLDSSEDPDLFSRLTQLHDPYRAGTGSAVTGLGWSPGLSNLLALHAAAEFDLLDSLGIYWSVAAPELRSPGGQERLLHGFRGKCRSFENGRLKEVRAGGWEEWRCFPPGVGWSGITYACQAEPLTLPDSLPGIIQVQVKGGLNVTVSPYLVHTLAWASHLLPEHLQELLNHGMGLALKSLHRPSGEDSLSGLCVEARGTRDGRRAEVAYGATGSYLEATAGMLTGALTLMRRGDRRQGYFTPEQAFTLRDLLPALRVEGVRFWEQ
jgi:lysine 6-dehydrogenase